MSTVPDVTHWPCDGAYVCRHGLSWDDGIVVHVNSRLPAHDVLIPHEWIEEAHKPYDKWPHSAEHTALNIAIGLACGSYRR